MAQLSEQKMDTITVKEILPGQRGGKLGSLAGTLSYKPADSDGLLVPFECGVYNGTGSETRVNIEFEVSEEQAAKFDDIDDSIIEQCSQRSNEIFKKTMSVDQVAEKYTRLIKRREGYKPKLRTKMDLSKVRVWNTENERRNVPENKFKKCKAWPLIRMKHLWVMGHGIGLACETTDIKIEEPDANLECPF